MYAYQLARFYNYASLVFESVRKKVAILNSCELSLSQENKIE